MKLKLALAMAVATCAAVPAFATSTISVVTGQCINVSDVNG